MTNKKITEFTELTAPASTDVLPIIDASDTSNKKISYSNLLGKAPDGSASAPAFSFNSDTNSGISGGSDTLTFSTGGVGRMSINSAGLVNIVGDLTVGGTTTTINTATLDVEDKNITLGKVSTPTDTTANEGGLTLKGATDKTFNWLDATDSWTSSEHLSVSAQKEIRYLDADNSNYVGFKSPATVASNVVWTLPSADSSVSGYVLSSDASGVLSWVAPGQNADPDFTGSLTLTDDGNIRGFASTHATYTGSVKTFTVTVATKTAAHRYSGSGSANGYVIDGKEAPFLTLTPGRAYKFDLSHSSNSGHPLRFYLESNKTTAYTTNVTVNGTAGQSGAYVQILIADTTPMVVHYQCSSHSLMGNSVQTNSATATGTLLSSLSVTGNMDVTGTFTVSDNILMTGTGAIDVAAGTTAQRPGSPSAGMLRFNNTTNEFEGYNGSSWGEIGGSTTLPVADLLDIASSSGTGGGSATFNNSAYRFKLVTKGTSTAITPSNAETLIVSINGVIQRPNDGTGQGDMTDGYVVSGTDIIFDSAPASGSTVFIVNLGAVGSGGGGGGSYGNSDVDSHLNVSSASSGQVLSWNGSDYAWVANSGGGSGISSIVEDTTPQLGGPLDTNTKNIEFGDGSNVAADQNRLTFGAADDLVLYHDGTGQTNIIEAPSGVLHIKADDFMLISHDTGGRAIYLDDSNSRLELGFDGNHAVYVSGTETTFIQDVAFQGSDSSTKILFDKSQDRLEFGDGVGASFGAHPDVSIAYENLLSNPFLGITGRYGGSGNIIIGYRNNAGTVAFNFEAERSGGASVIHHAGSEVLRTTSVGLTLTGAIIPSGTQFDIGNSSNFLRNVYIRDTGNIYMGDNQDLTISHGGSNGNINCSTGDLVIKTSGSGDDIFIDSIDDVNIRTNSTLDSIICTGGGGVELYHYAGSGVYSTKRLETTNAGITVTGTVTETSDIALKSNIEPLTDTLEKIQQITGYKYNFADTSNSSMGVIAQDVEKVFPELVHGLEGKKTLQYSGLIGVLVEAVKDLSAKVQVLEDKF